MASKLVEAALGDKADAWCESPEMQLAFCREPMRAATF
jgi:hypothetical protein